MINTKRMVDQELGNQPGYNWTGAAAIASAVIGAGASYYSAKKAEEAQEEAAAQAEAARLAEEERQRKVFESTTPEQEAATFKFGTQDQDDELGSYSEFLAPKPSKTLGGVTSSLGFGTLGGTL